MSTHAFITGLILGGRSSQFLLEQLQHTAGDFVLVKFVLERQMSVSDTASRSKNVQRIENDDAARAAP